MVCVERVRGARQVWVGDRVGVSVSGVSGV